MKLKKLPLLLLYLFAMNLLHAQPQEIRTIPFRPFGMRYMPAVVLPDKSIFCSAKGFYNNTTWGSILLNYKPYGALNWERQMILPNSLYPVQSVPAINTICSGGNRIIACGEVLNGINKEGFVSGLDLLGNVQWSFQYGIQAPSTTGSSIFENSCKVISNNNGSFTMSCIARPFSMYGNDNAYHTMVCFDTLGGILWSRCLAVSDFEPNSSALETDGNSLYVLFSDTSHSYIMKTDLAGVTQWTRILPRHYQALERTRDGNLLVATSDSTLSGTKAAYLAKISSSGNMLWSKRYTDPAGTSFLNNQVSELVNLTDSSMMLGITQGGYIHYGTGTHLLHLDKNGNVKNFLTHWSTYGCHNNSILEYEPGYLFIGSTDDYDTTTFALNLQVAFTDTSLNSMLCQYSQGNITVQALTETTTPIIMSASPCSFIKTTTNHISVVRNSPETISCITAIAEQPAQENTTLTLSPNPANDAVTLRWNTGSNYTLQVFDPAGRRVQQVNNVTGNTFTLQTAQLPAGLYMMQLQNEQQTMRARLVLSK